MVGKSSVQEIATLAIIWEVDSNLDTGRYSPKSGVFRIIRQHCHLARSLRSKRFRAV